MAPKAPKKKQAQLVAEALEEWAQKEDLLVKEEITQRVLLDAAKQQLAKLKRTQSGQVQKIESVIAERDHSMTSSLERQKQLRADLNDKSVLVLNTDTGIKNQQYQMETLRAQIYASNAEVVDLADQVDLVEGHHDNSEHSTLRRTRDILASDLFHLRQELIQLRSQEANIQAVLQSATKDRSARTPFFSAHSSSNKAATAVPRKRDCTVAPRNLLAHRLLCIGGGCGGAGGFLRHLVAEHFNCVNTFHLSTDLLTRPIVTESATPHSSSACLSLQQCASDPSSEVSRQLWNLVRSVNGEKDCFIALTGRVGSNSNGESVEICFHHPECDREEVVSLNLREVIELLFVQAGELGSLEQLVVAVDVCGSGTIPTPKSPSPLLRGYILLLFAERIAGEWIRRPPALFVRRTTSGLSSLPRDIPLVSPASDGVGLMAAAAALGAVVAQSGCGQRSNRRSFWCSDAFTGQSFVQAITKLLTCPLSSFEVERQLTLPQWLSATETQPWPSEEHLLTSLLLDRTWFEPHAVELTLASCADLQQNCNGDPKLQDFVSLAIGCPLLRPLLSAERLCPTEVEHLVIQESRVISNSVFLLASPLTKDRALATLESQLSRRFTADVSLCPSCQVPNELNPILAESRRHPLFVQITSLRQDTSDLDALLHTIVEKEFPPDSFCLRLEITSHRVDVSKVAAMALFARLSQPQPSLAPEENQPPFLCDVRLLGKSLRSPIKAHPDDLVRRLMYGWPFSSPSKLMNPLRLQIGVVISVPKSTGQFINLRRSQKH